MSAFEIGGVFIGGDIVLAPMAGVTDLPFRLLCRECGAAFAYTEMVSAKGIVYKNTNTKALLAIDERERPAAVQIFGGDPAVMAEAARMTGDLDFDVLDINMGCPVPKIVNNGEGSALMKDINLAARIIDAVVKAAKKPVTVKFRKGFAKGEDTAVEFAKMARHYGASAVAVHPRTREQYYSGDADWDVIARVKAAVDIPVIGSGDIKEVADVKKMRERTGADACMIGRAARGNPWIFKRAAAYMETGEAPPPPKEREIAEMMIRHAKMLVEYEGEYPAMRKMRGHAAWYVRGLKDSAKFRNALCRVDTFKEFSDMVNRFMPEG